MFIHMHPAAGSPGTRQSCPLYWSGEPATSAPFTGPGCAGPPFLCGPAGSLLKAVNIGNIRAQVVIVAATVVVCLFAYGVMSYATAPDFNSAIDLEAKYRALLSAHEETARAVDTLKKEALLPASKVDASL